MAYHLLCLIVGGYWINQGSRAYPTHAPPNLRDSAEMNIDRYMVNLFFEIKRNIPHQQQAELKISDPNIGEVMTALYRETKDENIKLLVRIFLERAGGKWASDADKPKILSNALKRLSKNDAPEAKVDTSSTELRDKPKRIYRGQVIED